ncbi:MAG: hypothetical protein HC913_19025 [Microscillaceae bacterium]|nr:hypothetical protein [Microscillaceae bacterium]
MKTPSWLPYLGLWLLTLFLGGLCRAWQAEIVYLDCTNCDGNEYHKIYQFFESPTAPYAVKFPFHQRVLVPYLASCLPFARAEDNFWAISLLFASLAVPLLWRVWAILQIPGWLRVLALVILLGHFQGLLRYNAYDVITVDVPLYFVGAGFLWAILSQKWYWIGLMAPLAQAQKESFLALILLGALFFVLTKPDEKAGKPSGWMWAGLIIILVIEQQSLAYFFPAADGEGKGSLRTLLFFVRETLYHPLDLVRWVLAIGVGYGLWAVLALRKLGTHFPSSASGRGLLGLVGLHLAFGLLAGRDMTRIVFLGFPFVMTGMLMMLKTEKWTLIVWAFALSLPLGRPFEAIPAGPSHWSAYREWFPEYASEASLWAWAIYLWLGFCILEMLRYLGARQAKN